MVRHILEAYEADRTIRIEGMERSNNTGWRVNVHEIRPGVVLKDAKVTVSAFPVRHGNVQTYGYRFATPDRTVVISGDTSPTDAIVENCHACDILIHEAYTKASCDLVPEAWQQYRRVHHTSALELGAIALKRNLGCLIHRANPGCDQIGTAECRQAGNEEQLLKEVREAYSGKVVAGHDLDIY